MGCRVGTAGAEAVCVVGACGIRFCILLLYVVYMRAPNDKASGTSDEPPVKSTVLLLLATIVDTTWRMFVPTLGLAAAGLWADTSWGTGPLWSLVGVFSGIAIAALLVRKQFKNLAKNS
jgi:hypothetical protein